MRLFHVGDSASEPENESSATPDEDRFETVSKIFLERRDLVRSVAVRYAPSKEVIDDIVQEVYVEFASRAEKWDLRTDVSALLAVMTRNFARRMWRDYLRSLPETKRRILEILQKRSEERDFPYGEDEREALRGCVETLSSAGRRLIKDYYFHRIPLKEIAETMEKSPETLRRALCRYRTKLRSCVMRILQMRPGRTEQD